MVQHQIKDDGNAPLLAFGDELFHVLHGAEHRVNGAVVRNIVAVVHLGGGADRGQPDAVNAQLLQVGKLLQDAPQVTGAISVGIGEGSYKDLIENIGIAPKTK